MFPVGSLCEFLIPIGPFVRSRRLWSTRAAYVVVNYHLHVTYNSKYCTLQYAYPIYKYILKCDWLITALAPLIDALFIFKIVLDCVNWWFSRNLQQLSFLLYKKNRLGNGKNNKRTILEIKKPVEVRVFFTTQNYSCVVKKIGIQSRYPVPRSSCARTYDLKAYKNRLSKIKLL